MMASTREETVAMTQLDGALAAPQQHADDADQHAKLGRKRDHSRDPEILDAALEVLGECGYDGMTIDMVATRAKAGKATLYRRWPSKAELVIEAVACMKQAQSRVEDLPDTGSLRGDLVALIRPHSMEESERKMQVMGGVVSMLSRDPQLAEAVNEAITEPRARLNRLLIERAIERGEVRADVGRPRVPPEPDRRHRPPGPRRAAPAGLSAPGRWAAPIAQAVLRPRSDP
jgi:AcrR family transcriptional regulator